MAGAVRAPALIAAGVLALLGACAPGGGSGSGGGWQALRGTPAAPALARLGTPDSVEQQGAERVYLFRRYRLVNSEPMAPILTPQGQIITPRPPNPVALCETRVRVDAQGRIADIAQTGGACAELMPVPG